MFTVTAASQEGNKDLLLKAYDERAIYENRLKQNGASPSPDKFITTTFRLFETVLFSAYDAQQHEMKDFLNKFYPNFNMSTDSLCNHIKLHRDYGKYNDLVTEGRSFIAFQVLEGEVVSHFKQVCLLYDYFQRLLICLSRSGGPDDLEGTPVELAQIFRQKSDEIRLVKPAKYFRHSPAEGEKVAPAKRFRYELNYIA